MLGLMESWSFVGQMKLIKCINKNCVDNYPNSLIFLLLQADITLLSIDLFLLLGIWESVEHLKHVSEANEAADNGDTKQNLVDSAALQVDWQTIVFLQIKIWCWI